MLSGTSPPSLYNVTSYIKRLDAKSLFIFLKPSVISEKSLKTFKSILKSFILAKLTSSKYIALTLCLTLSANTLASCFSRSGSLSSLALSWSVIY